MPAWKWAPDNARLKLATPNLSLCLVGTNRPAINIPSVVACDAFDVPPPEIKLFSIDDLPEAITILCRIIRSAYFDDMVLPISFFQAFINNNTGDSLSVVIPNLILADDISDRAEGSIALSKARYNTDGTRMIEDIVILPISDIRLDEGARNQSITITAREDG